jgi:hypothetical protein
MLLLLPASFYPLVVELEGFSFCFVLLLLLVVQEAICQTTAIIAPPTHKCIKTICPIRLN